MLEPREVDIPILFLVLVVLPVVVYILLGIWSEPLAKRGRINYLSQMEAEETYRSEAMATASKVLRGKTAVAASGYLKAETVAAASGVPVMVRSNKDLHVCARCLTPARTRCSRCKSVRYCSGKCQIIHWRLFHKDECVPVESLSASTGKFSCDDESASLGESQVDNVPQVQIQDRRSVGRRNSCKCNKESRRKDGVRMFGTSGKFFGGEGACVDGNSASMLKESGIKHKSKSKGYAGRKSHKKCC